MAIFLAKGDDLKAVAQLLLATRGNARSVVGNLESIAPLCTDETAVAAIKMAISCANEIDDRTRYVYSLIAVEAFGGSATA